MSPISLAILGCGSRARAYSTIAATMPDKYVIVAAADPVAERVNTIRAKSSFQQFQAFSSGDEILARPKLADVLIITTQDNYHFAPCKQALEKGYDILLEKPIAPKLHEVLELREIATRLRRQVIVCHVLRYAPFYTTVKQILDAGEIGEIISLNAIEGVHPWHQAHSFVRGHWSVAEKTTPMIVAKSCHDMDIITWFINRPCESVSSYGGLNHFTAANAPQHAPLRCTDGCPSGETCLYNSDRYIAEEGRRWLAMVYDRAWEAEPDEILNWLKTSQWGRCVYHCDNTAIDHQVIAFKFAGGATATFTTTAFEEGRHLEIYGTKGTIKGGIFYKKHAGADIIVTRFAGGTRRIVLPPQTGHGGGDQRLMEALYHDMVKTGNIGGDSPARTSLESSIQSHIMGFAAEHSRLTNQTVHIEEFLRPAR